MTDLDTEALRDVIQHQHGGTASFVQSVPVKENFNGQLVWDGIVSVFDLAQNPLASRVYAWSSPVEGSSKRRFYAVLHIPPIDSPLKAVQAAIVAEHRANAEGSQQ